MRDAARAAAMSDPTLNTWFRRRWADLPTTASAYPRGSRPADSDELAVTGLALLEEWRRQRDAARVNV